MNSKSLPLLILGAGGHAKVLIEIFRLHQQKTLGIISPNLNSGSIFEGLNVLGDDEAVYKYNPKEILLINAVGALPNNQNRWHLSNLMRKKRFKFDNVIHPSSIVANDLSIGEGVQLMAGTIIQPGCKIGQDSIVNTGARIDHDTSIGDQCHIAPGVTICGDVQIGNNVHIGTGSQVLQGIKIGNHTVIAAGTLVYKDIPSGVLVKHNVKMLIESLKG